MGAVAGGAGGDGLFSNGDDGNVGAGGNGGQLFGQPEATGAAG